MKLKNAIAMTILLTGGLFASVSTTLAQQSGEVVNLRSEFRRGECLTMATTGRMADCTTANSQKITLVRAELNAWKLRVGNLCVLPAPASDAVKLGSCSHPASKWSFNSHGQIKSDRGNCLHIWARDASNPKVTTNRCTGQKIQKWARYQPLSPEGTSGSMNRAMISPKSAPGKCLDLANRRALVIWDCHGGNNQRLSFT